MLSSRPPTVRVRHNSYDHEEIVKASIDPKYLINITVVILLANYRAALSNRFRRAPNGLPGYPQLFWKFGNKIWEPVGQPARRPRH
jgi:hypothetical protein